MNKKILNSVTAFALALIFFNSHGRGVYQEPEAFLREAFADDPPKAARLWINKELREQIKQILEHDLGVMRLHYWRREQRTVWILEEIGKEQPITAGIVIDRDKIESVKVLVFRESRGWEIRYPFFTDQFKDAALVQGNELSKHIDGISGATLSVNALTKLARLALLLHRHIMINDGEAGRQ